jgi:hypothetical protein
MASQDVATAVAGLDESLQALPATMISALNGWRLVNPEHDPSDPTSQETYSFPEWLVRSSVRAGRAEAPRWRRSRHWPPSNRGSTRNRCSN